MHPILWAIYLHMHILKFMYKLCLEGFNHELKFRKLILNYQDLVFNHGHKYMHHVKSMNIINEYDWIIHTNPAIFLIMAAGFEFSPFTNVIASCFNMESFLSLRASTRITLGLSPSASKAWSSSIEGIVSKSSLNLLSYKIWRITEQQSWPPMN